MCRRYAAVTSMIALSPIGSRQAQGIRTPPLDIEANRTSPTGEYGDLGVTKWGASRKVIHK